MIAVAKTRLIPIPFNNRGHQLHYHEHETVWRDNHEFEATLVFRGMARGRSAAYALFSDKKTGKDLTMFLVDLADVIMSKPIEGGMITAKWTFCKRGQNYGVRLVEEEVKK